MEIINTMDRRVVFFIFNCFFNWYSLSRLLYLHFNWAAWPWNLMWWNFFPSILNSLFFEKIHEPNILFFDFSLGSLCCCIRLACELLWSDLGLCKFINALHFKCIVVFNLKFIFFQPQSLKNWGYTFFLSFSFSA